MVGRKRSLAAPDSGNRFSEKLVPRASRSAIGPAHEVRRLLMDRSAEARLGCRSFPNS